MITFPNRIKVYIFIAVSLLITGSSCQTDKDAQNNKKTDNRIISVNDKANAIKKQTETNRQTKTKQSSNNRIKTNSLSMQKALFIAAEKSSLFSVNQSKQYYKDYTKALNKSWGIVTTKNLDEIKKWNNKYPLVKNDSLTLLYPFSGPDFLYANAFFPNAKDYILIGLEKIGYLPEFSKMTEVELSSYLNKLHSSLRYANQAAYFMTKHMIEDFSSPYFNGATHLICLYLIKTKHKIISIKPVQINHFGVIEKKAAYKNNKEFVNGVSFKVANHKGKIKNVYYFSTDLSNNNLSKRIGLTSFLSKMGKKNVFIKSASYLLHNREFTILRDLIIKQSETIIQDDTGVPFAVLKSSGFSTKLFGNYSRTIKVFKNYFQKDLSQSLENERIGFLPFKLGYNSWKGEMVLLVSISGGKKISKPVTYKTQKQGVVFKVQIKTSWHEISINSDSFRELPPVQFYKENDMYKYTIGNFSSYEACNDYVRKARDNGFTGAFVVAFYKNNRISLSQAKKIINAHR